MKVLTSIIKNDNSRKEGNRVFNTFRIYLFIEIHEKSKVKVRIVFLVYYIACKLRQLAAASARYFNPCHVE